MTKVKDLSDEQEKLIAEGLKDMVLENDLKREVMTHIKRLKEIKCYRWMRHNLWLPVRGQLTRKNGRTAKKLLGRARASIINRGAGTMGFKWAKKSTPYAAEVLTKEVLKEAATYGLDHVGIVFKGTGMGREGIFKAINETGLVEIDYIQEATAIQFGGCKRIRPKRN